MRFSDDAILRALKRPESAFHWMSGGVNQSMGGNYWFPEEKNNIKIDLKMSKDNIFSLHFGIPLNVTS